nr:MAG TPA: minor structural protein [Caudoviricetes sp.]DAJ89051.1 MAG TPA: minor structural protein [Caudoviricetes sp.]DAR22285.1 MAG TPA: minor structural protein [Caudoviricetes sp.]
MGFTYGINLTNLSRTIKTDSLVTKLYVDYSENNYTSDGYVAISSAEDNISKENVLYNFDYFIQVGLLEKMQVYNDFYKIESSEVSAQDPLEMKCVIEANGKNGPGYLRLLGLLNT